MPPKAKVTRENILSACVEIIRESGFDAVNARALASRLGCSTQPIFSHYQSMDALKDDALRYAEQVYRRYLRTDMQSGEFPPYKASGMAYIRFAREEKQLFRLLFMRDRRGEPPQEDELSPELLTAICAATGLEPSEAERFHLEMWIFVHGIAVMVATGYLEWDMDFVSDALTHMYGAMLADKRGVKNGSDKN